MIDFYRWGFVCWSYHFFPLWISSFELDLWLLKEICIYPLSVLLCLWFTQSMFFAQLPLLSQERLVYISFFLAFTTIFFFFLFFWMSTYKLTKVLLHLLISVILHDLIKASSNNSIYGLHGISHIPWSTISTKKNILFYQKNLMNLSYTFV